MRPTQALDIFADSFKMPVVTKFTSAVKIALEYGYESAESYFQTIEQDIMEVRRVAIEELTKSKPEKAYQLYMILMALAVGEMCIRDSHTTVAIAEMPCQGIPRLGFISETMERERCVENALQELEKTGYLTLSQLCKKSDNLALLAASVYATPDYPLINRLSLSTLMDYPVKFIHTARQLGYQTILFECQGQLTTPMTFFALKNADYLFITVPKMADLAFTIINIKHLVQTFKMSSGQIFLVGDIDPLSLKDLAVVIDDEGGTLETLTIIRQPVSYTHLHINSP